MIIKNKKMLFPTKTIRCRKCNKILGSFDGSHNCSKADVKLVWRTRANPNKNKIEKMDKYFKNIIKNKANEKHILTNTKGYKLKKIK
jgi:phage FluMu protein Com